MTDWLVIAVAFVGVVFTLVGAVLVTRDGRFAKGQYGAWLVTVGLLFLLAAWARGG